MEGGHVIEITPELHRRVSGERRKSTRDRLTDLERRLDLISTLAMEAMQRTPWETFHLLDEIHQLAQVSMEPRGDNA